jgi:hypothetical protein
MATKQTTKQRSKAASAAASARWAGISPLDRAEKMRVLTSSRARLTPEHLATLEWIAANREALAGILASWNARDVMLITGLSTADVELSERDLEKKVLEMPAPSNPAAVCSVCLSPIADLDEPCPECVKAGRINRTTNADEFLAAQQRAASHRVLEDVNVPTLQNAVPARAPLPPPPPPPRPYSYTETCRACGRLAELHMDKGGPIQHSWEPQLQGMA